MPVVPLEGRPFCPLPRLPRSSRGTDKSFSEGLVPLREQQHRPRPIAPAMLAASVGGEDFLGEQDCKNPPVPG